MSNMPVRTDQTDLFARLREWLHNTALQDPLERAQAPMVQFLLIGLIICLSLALPLALTASTQIGVLVNLAALLGSIATMAVALWILRRGYFNQAVTVMNICLVLGGIALLLPTGTGSTGGIVMIFTIPVAVAGVVQDRRQLLLVFGLSSLGMALVAILEVIVPSMVGFEGQTASIPARVLAFIIVLTPLALILDRFNGTLRVALTAARAKEAELEQIRIQQEEIIAKRTAALETLLSEFEQRELQLHQALTDLQANREELRELSAPVIPVLPGVLVAPITGALNGQRMGLLTQRLLETVKQQYARAAIFDVTGVAVIDTQVARVLLDTATAIRLLGAQAVLVGISPEVAQTLVTLGIQLDRVRIFANLQSAVEAMA